MTSLKEMKKIAQSRTGGIWPDSKAFITDLFDPVTLSERGSSIGHNNIAFVVMASNHIDALIKIAEAAKKVKESTFKVYSGCPGKLDWPEIHTLSQALEELEQI